MVVIQQGEVRQGEACSFVLVAALFVVDDAAHAEGDEMGEAVVPVGTVLVDCCPSFGKMTELGEMARGMG